MSRKRKTNRPRGAPTAAPDSLPAPVQPCSQPDDSAKLADIRPNGNVERQKFCLELAGVIGIYLAAGLAGYFAFGQTRVMRGQLDQMSADQRPWIYPRLSLAGPLTWAIGKQAQIRLFVSLKNAGHSPAKNVVLKFEAHPLTKEIIFNSIPEQERLCEAARKEADRDSLSGRYLFPNEVDEGGASANSEVTNAWPSETNAIFRLVGCVDYTFTSDSRIHGQTGFSYELARVTDGGAHRAGFNPDAGAVPEHEMVLKSDFFKGKNLLK